MIGTEMEFWENFKALSNEEQNELIFFMAKALAENLPTSNANLCFECGERTD